MDSMEREALMNLVIIFLIGIIGGLGACIPLYLTLLLAKTTGVF